MNTVSQGHFSIFEKSATRCTASRTRANIPSRAARFAGSVSLTITASKKLSMGARSSQAQPSHPRNPRRRSPLRPRLGRIEAPRRARSRQARICSGRNGRRCFFLQDIGGALVAGEQIGAILGRDEALQRLHPREQADQIILPAQREHRVDQVVTDAGLALLDLQAVGEEIEQFGCVERHGLTVNGQTSLGTRSNTASRFSLVPLTRTVWIVCSAARRSANGSFEPVGRMPCAKKAANVSIRSASATQAGMQPSTAARYCCCSAGDGARLLRHDRHNSRP